MSRPIACKDCWSYIKQPRCSVRLRCEECAERRAARFRHAYETRRYREKRQNNPTWRAQNKRNARAWHDREAA